MRRVSILAGLSAAAVLATAGASSAMAATPLNYRVAVTNLTPNDLTPLVVATHDKRATLWRAGSRPSNGLANLARDGATSGLLAEAQRKRGVRQAFTTSRIAPGRSIRFNVRTTSGQRRLSFASMLIATNDGFTGLSSFTLPVRNGRAAGATRNVKAYDGGAERNTELRQHVPSLGAHFVGPTERRAVRAHPGIRGNADVPAAEDWGKFAARVTVRPVRS